MSPQELQVQQKRADIFEAPSELTMVLEMPGVDKSNIDISVEAGVLTIEGRLDFSKYEGMQPVYTEYNIGLYRRQRLDRRLPVGMTLRASAARLVLIE